MKRSLICATASSMLIISAGAAAAATLPAIKAGGANAVPQCVTPGRLMAFLAARNPKLDSRYAGIATAYMHHGERMGIRWDYAFYQMMLETGSLSYTRDGSKPGDVKPRQNNFAGLGATGKGEPGESFASIEQGVKAHLQHLAMYSGERVDEPVAERTRKVQEWGVLTSWQKGFARPITFSDLANKWAPGSRGYASNVDSFRTGFHDDFCGKPDPKPELVQEARAGGATQAMVAASKPEPKQEKSAGTELARQAIERARSEGAPARSALGGNAIVPAKPFAGEGAPPAGLTILNEQAAEAKPEEPAPAAAVVAETPAKKQPTFQTASAGNGAKPSTSKGQAAAAATVTAAALPKAPSPPPSEPAAQSKCRVYTASYGGQKAVIIRAAGDQFTNFTVLDVNEGQEAREIEAYVAAYAKGGQKVGEFSTSNAALDKAFELCPEG